MAIWSLLQLHYPGSTVAVDMCKGGYIIVLCYYFIYKIDAWPDVSFGPALPGHGIWYLIS